MKRLLILCSFVLFSVKLYSWGADGHKIVAAFAKKALSATPNVVDSVLHYLNGLSFEKASVWMDEIKSDTKEYNEWHYVNVERDNTYVKTKDPNVVNKLEWAIDVLKNRKGKSSHDINFALKLLFHLVGDIHQPLHVGYGSDRGGNDFPVTYSGENTNLHHVWDSDIIRFEKISLADCLKLSNTLTAEDQKKIQNASVEEWMNEGREQLAFIYNFQKGKITGEYSTEAKAVIEKQLTKAGIRLAAILYRSFSK